MKSNSLHLECLEKAVAGLGSAFHWDSSDEGFQYWRDVMEKLERYRDQARKSGSCRKEIEELKKKIAELEQRC
jgi:hypothetical protein